MNRKKFIYISGKMGEKILSEATVKKFEEAHRKMEEAGWSVINPASYVFQQDAQRKVGSDIEEYKQTGFVNLDWYAGMLLYDMEVLALCDAIYMLSDWQDSPGATAEYYYAKACKKEIIFE